MLLSLIPVFILISLRPIHLSSFGGNCWASMFQKGKCKELISINTTQSECCSSKEVGIAWSSEYLDSGTMFFWRVLGGGVDCVSCKATCDKIDCGPDKKCIIKDGRPQCICARDCQTMNQMYRNKYGVSPYSGPVCGSDGRSYKSTCHLLKRACRKQISSLSIAYNGKCQKTCSKIKCSADKQCLLDQNLNSHCVHCNRKCQFIKDAHICGTNDVTYKTPCHLRLAACDKGKAIPMAYRGRCKANATCDNIKCRDRQQCLIELSSGKPRCVTCNQKCGWQNEPVCGSNRKTYESWCLMVQDACATGYVIDTMHSGPCTNNTQYTIIN